jgi:hypothetical protein
MTPRSSIALHVHETGEDEEECDNRDRKLNQGI